MDEALKFITELIRVERELSVAAYEEEASRYSALIAGLGDALIHGVTLGFPRVEDPPPGWLQARRKILPTVCARELFQVLRHDHPEYGVIYRAYLSGNRTDERDEYDQCWVVGTRAGCPRLAARYRVCWECDGLARLGAGASCRACGGLGWVRREGLELSSWGRVVHTRKLRPPKPDAQRLEYDVGGG